MYYFCFTAVPAGSTPTPTTYDYTYAARSAQTAYDTTKTYYQQQTPAAATYSTTDYPGWHTTGGNYQNDITSRRSVSLFSYVQLLSLQKSYCARYTV